MKAEIKELLKEEIKAVNNSKISVIIGFSMIILNSLLVAASIINPFSLFFIFPLVLVLQHQINEFKLNQFILMVNRVIVDEDYLNQILEEDGND
jgi:hypothetical protein